MRLVRDTELFEKIKKHYAQLREDLLDDYQGDQTLSHILREKVVINLSSLGKSTFIFQEYSRKERRFSSRFLTVEINYYKSHEEELKDWIKHITTSVISGLLVFFITYLITK
jgi:hypothetical protein